MKKNRGGKGAADPTPTHPSQPMVEQEKEKEQRPKHSKLKKKGSHTSKRQWRRARECDESDECSDGEEADDEAEEEEEEYEPRRMKSKKAIRRVSMPTPPRRPAIRRVIKRGAGNDFLDYGKKFTKAFSRLPDEVRPDLVDYVQPKLKRGFRSFIRQLLTDHELRKSLTDVERAILFENNGEALLGELADKSSNPFEQKYKPLTNTVMNLINDFKNAGDAARPQPPPARPSTSKGRQKEVNSSSDDDDDDDDEEEEAREIDVE